MAQEALRRALSASTKRFKRDEKNERDADGNEIQGTSEKARVEQEKKELK